MRNDFSIVVLISGNGSNLQAIIDAKVAPVAAVISNQADAYGLERARKANLPTEIISATSGETREMYDQRLQACINTYQPKLIVLAGFMRILSADFINRYPNQIINIHPSLLPKFKGLDTHQQALDAGEHEHGCSIHLVTAALDSGPVLAQAHCPIEAGDTVDSLQQRVHQLEHQLYPKVISWFVDQRINVNTAAVELDGQPITQLPDNN